ncbi:Peptidylglycine monooxygenase [Aphelenchoides fujianensis]|nr:Peptidylglycine monooxygenase [Aphelenchoides fujianensis]
MRQTNEIFSGVKLSFTEAPQPRAAGTLLIVTGGEIAANTRDTFEAACVVNEPVEFPQLEQLFEPVKNKSLTISQGDIVAARCVINNNEKHAIQIGPTGEDEMCNFYVMYYVENGESNALRDNTCYSPGPPNYTWMREAGLNSIPKM